MRRLKLFVVLLIICIPIFGRTIYAETLELTAKSAILVEETTGKVLYAKAENERMYPASMTKLLTAMIVLDYFQPDEIITAGPEIFKAPRGSSLAKHREGEALSIKNLIRALIIVSGNDSSCLAAKAVITKKEGEQPDYATIQKKFSDLMNAKAKELGANNSNFINPHGFHDPNHYTTARDMALIAGAAVKNDLIRQISAEKSYTGPSVENNTDPNLRISQYDWQSHNLLINSEEYGYPYATGLKTGFHDEASHCVAASAEKGDVKLISVVFYSPEPERWFDSKKLFDYGFKNFGYVTVGKEGVLDENIRLVNSRLGEPDTLTVLTNETQTQFLNFADSKNITQKITYKSEFLPTEEETEKVREADKNQKEPKPEPSAYLKAPLAEAQVVGTVEYILDGQVLFKGDVITQNEVLERNFESDMNYYFTQAKNFIFSVNSLPYFAALIIIIVGIIILAKRRQSRYRYSRSRRLRSNRNRRYR